jgi:hypothetical protein
MSERWCEGSYLTSILGEVVFQGCFFPGCHYPFDGSISLFNVGSSVRSLFVSMCHHGPRPYPLIYFFEINGGEGPALFIFIFFLKIKNEKVF